MALWNWLLLRTSSEPPACDQLRTSLNQFKPAAIFQNIPNQLILFFLNRVNVQYTVVAFAYKQSAKLQSTKSTPNTKNRCLKRLIGSHPIISGTWVCHHVTHLHNCPPTGCFCLPSNNSWVCDSDMSRRRCFFHCQGKTHCIDLL